MERLRARLNADPTDWLLEQNNPSVRFLALRDLLDLSPRALVEESEARIMKEGVVPRILARQEAGGYWGVPEDFYVRGKYKGTSWTLLVLAEHWADGGDERVRRATEFILERSQDPESGGFSYACSPTGGDHDRVLPCLTGNMAWAMVRLGRLGDSRVRRAIDWLVRYQRCDDGEGPAPSGWPYERHRNCWGSHTCHMAVVKALKVFSEVPPSERTGAMAAAIASGCEHLLKHRIFKRSHDPEQVSKAEWLDFGFPLMWNTDALEVLGVLVGLGIRDERMRDAALLVEAKQDANGRWTMDRSFNGRLQVNVESKGAPSKWITLHALRALKGYYS